MKKIVALLLALVMVLSMAACEKNDPGTDEPETSKEPETSNTSDAATSAADPTVEVVEDDEFTHTFTQFGNARIKIEARKLPRMPWEKTCCASISTTRTPTLSLMIVVPFGRLNSSALPRMGRSAIHTF